MKDLKLEGIIPALITPMTHDASAIDEEALVRLTNRLVEAGVGGLLTCGSTGEMPTLSDEERRRVTKVAVGAASGRVPVIAHTSALSTRQTIALSLDAQEVGADAIMVVPPYYDPPRWSELVAHYAAVASAVDVPVVIYNIPMVTGLELTPDQIAELAAINGVRYVKDSTGNAVALTELIERFGSRVGVINGWDSLTFMALFAGAKGVIWGAANFMPDLCVRLYRSIVVDGDVQAAHKLWSLIWPICHFLEHEGYVSTVKAACDMIGEPAGGVRAPLQALESDKLGRLRLLLDSAGLRVTARTTG